MPFTVSSGWVGRYKIGDNINYTLQVLADLYEARNESDDLDHLVQPIVILQASICEATIYDLIETRIRRHTWEPVDSIRDEVVEALRRAKFYDKFKKLINIAKPHLLLGDDQGFYTELHWIRKARNRVHLQGLSNDNDYFFNNAVLVRSESVIEMLLKKMAQMYPRDPAYHVHVADFEVPWDERIQ